MTSEMIIVLIVLLITVGLIVTELLRIDVVALMAMLTLTWFGIIDPKQALGGFSSNAVIAVLAVMILGRGLFKSGVTDQIAAFILQVAGKGEQRVQATVSATVGIMSGFMQNLGAAALFLPVMQDISKREQIPISNLLMPMGFSALLGGTLTMVGTSSLIVLNDLLPPDKEFGLFAVMPIGITLLLAGMLYFFLFGRNVLPSETVHDQNPSTPQLNLINTWGISDTIQTYKIQPDSPLIGQTMEDASIGQEFNINLLRVRDEESDDYDLWEDPEFRAYQTLVVQGDESNLERFAEASGVKLKEEAEDFAQDQKRGYIEVVIPARSSLVGKTIREVSFRETYQAQVVLYFSDSKVVGENVKDRLIKSGDTMILHGTWDNLRIFKESEDFITVTPIKDGGPEQSPEKAWFATGSFIGAIALVFLTGIPISIGFLTGALAMILTGVISVEEAYKTVQWKVVFMIAGLISIGKAMETSGTAEKIANEMIPMLASVHPYFILIVLGVMTTVFSLLMSNIATTVLLVPLVLQISQGIGVNGQAMVLLVGICAANSFIIPTHHVNALLMTPGGYRVKDYLIAGTGLSVVFLLTSVTMIFFFYL